MINFWRKAGQFITEAILKNKTQDEQYLELCNQMVRIESGINSFKNILKNFNTYSEPFYKYIKTLNESLSQIYRDSPLTSYIDNISLKHEYILDDIDNLGKIISKLYSKTSEWDTIFEKAREIQKTKEEKRKNFDHYEQKLLKIEGDINKKKKGELLLRNQEKYRKALREYLDMSEKSFEVLKNSIILSWELTNPIVGELLILEKKISEKVTSHFYEFGNVTLIFDKAMNEAFNPDYQEEGENNFNYDPKRCIRSQTLMRKNNDDCSYEHVFSRNTKTFEKPSTERHLKFLEIIDDFSFKTNK